MKFQRTMQWHDRGTANHRNSSNISKDEVEAAYVWLMNLLREKSELHFSELSVFGKITLDIPVSECNPDIVEKIIAANHIVLQKKKKWYNSKTNELSMVRLTYNTALDGIIRMPIN